MVYTSFVSIYILSQLENPSFLEARQLKELGQIDLETIKKASHVLKFQCGEVVTQIFEIMEKNIPSHGEPDKINWGTFSDLIRQIIPTTLEDKMDLFLTSFVPKEYDGRT